MNSVLACGWLFEINPTLVDPFIFSEDRFEDEANFIAVCFEMGPAVEHLVVGPMLGILHVLSTRIHTKTDIRKTTLYKMTKRALIKMCVTEPII